MYMAAAMGHDKAIALLVTKGADLHIEDKV